MLQDIIEDLVDSINTEVQGVLGVSFKPLQYVLNVERNSFRGNEDRYGVIHGEANQLPGVTRFATWNQSFTIVLTKGYVESSKDDLKARNANIELYGLMHTIHKQLIYSKAGLPSIVLHVPSTIEIEEPEYDEEQKVTILRANIEIQYRYDLV